MATVAGIDGCPGGWLCLIGNLSTKAVDQRVLTQIDQILLIEPRPDVITIDIPIGLTESGPRQCDPAARALLRPLRASSVFPAPVRPTLSATSYEHACALG